MSSTAVDRPSGRGPAGAPCRDLYIYYLEGRTPPEPAGLGAFFLGNWQEAESAFLFFSRPCDEAVRGLLRGRPHLTLIDKYHMTYEQWQGGEIAPFNAGRFRIAPPWADAAAAADILLDPGLVFGTGTHPTTRDCLEALSLLGTLAPVSSAVDLGTGTGVLALAAARAGSRRTLAVDLNFLAVKTAAGNVRRNGLSDRVLVIQGRAQDWIHCPADLVVANIHYDVMKKLIDTDGFQRKKWFILSGLLRSQAGEIAARLSGRPVTLVKRWAGDGVWHTFLGTTR